VADLHPGTGGITAKSLTGWKDHWILTTNQHSGHRMYCAVDSFHHARERPTGWTFLPRWFGRPSEAANHLRWACSSHVGACAPAGALQAACEAYLAVAGQTAASQSYAAEGSVDRVDEFAYILNIPVVWMFHVKPDHPPSC
jgi:hypothetical protein